MSDQTWIICASNDGYAANLEPRKVYQALAEEPHGMLRIVDESGDAYLYPASMFVRIELSEAARKALRRAA